MTETFLPQAPKQPWEKGTFICECGESVQRMGGAHKRCKDCSKKIASEKYGKTFDRYFPVYRESERWILEHLSGREPEYNITQRDRMRSRRRKDILVKALSIPSPCDLCNYSVNCALKQLACKSFTVWCESEKKYPTWGKRVNPSRKWFVRSFPKDPSVTKEEREKWETLSHITGRPRRIPEPKYTFKRVSRPVERISE